LAGATPDYLTIFYYREGPNARASLYANPESIDVLAPQTYGLNAKGELKGSLNPDILAFAEKHQIKVMPLITNGAFSKSVAHAILDDRKKQNFAIDQLIAEAEKYGYWGWQIDFEQIDASYRDKFSAFMKRVGKAFKKNDLILSVAVVSKISDKPSDYKNTLWQDLIGVFDYSALAKSVDFISVMSYDDPDSKGPVARYAWLKQVLKYSLKKVPAEKLSLGIPFYYWQWNDQTGKLVDIGGRNGINEIFQTLKVKTNYSTEHQAPYLTFWDQGKPYTLWYENDRSVEKKINLIKKYGLHGFSAWALGLELPIIYTAVN
jgi:spore germination protein YaaH